MDDRLSHEHDDDGVSRRDFAVLSVATGLAVGAVTSANAADAAVVETDVMVKTPDGMCDAAYFHPATGVHPGVFVWCDAFGLRAATRGIGRRLASAGYSVLVPNPYYRVQKAPVVEDASKFDFNNPTDRNKLQPLMGALSAPGAAERDTVAYVAFLDAQKEVDKSKKIGVQGYCMGGPLMMRAASASERIGAGAAFHGGNNLVTEIGRAHV